jgi:glycosyltransferase involved in cell wall biosynthesis
MKILMLDPVGSVSSSGSDGINRQEFYMSKTSNSEILNNSKLIIVTQIRTKEKKEIFRSERISIFYCKYAYFKKIRFFLKALRITFSVRDEIAFFIAGDPWFSFWHSWLIKGICRIKAPIQIQIHADIGDPNWIKQNIKNRIKSQLAIMAIRRGSQIRVVNSHMLQYLKRKIKSDLLDVFVCPLPITYSAIENEVGRRKPKVKHLATIGFVGRVSADRGLSNFFLIAKKLVNLDLVSTIYIVGGGDEKTYRKFQNLMNTLKPDAEVIFTGFLSQAALEKIWPKIGILISSAPSESFGRAIREALAHNVPVWGIASNGISNLIKSYKSDWCELLDVSASNEELIKVFRKLDSLNGHSGMYEIFKDESDLMAIKLVNKWEELVLKG